MNYEESKLLLFFPVPIGNRPIWNIARKRGDLIDLASMREREKFIFSGQIAFVRFSNDGKKIFVLTVNHQVYVLDVAAQVASPKS